jgi:hypothetical protein
VGGNPIEHRQAEGASRPPGTPELRSSSPGRDLREQAGEPVRAEDHGRNLQDVPRVIGEAALEALERVRAADVAPGRARPKIMGLWYKFWDV